MEQLTQFEKKKDPLTLMPVGHQIKTLGQSLELLNKDKGTCFKNRSIYICIQNSFIKLHKPVKTKSWL